MNYINLGYGYRLHRRDSRNWKLQEFRKIKPNNNPKAEVGASKWRYCGKFYQSLRAALLAVYELVLREDNGEAVKPQGRTGPRRGNREEPKGRVGRFAQQKMMDGGY